MHGQLPENISYDEAATMPVTLSTALVGLCAKPPIGIGLNPTFSRSQPQKGQSALVIGGSSSVGQFGTALSPIPCFRPDRLRSDPASEVPRVHDHRSVRLSAPCRISQIAGCDRRY